jgi:hypothetical protein
MVSTFARFTVNIALTGRELYGFARRDAFPCSSFTAKLLRGYGPQFVPIPAMLPL